MAVKKIGNFVPRSEILFLTRRTIVLADPTLVDPNNAVCLVDGEWLRKDANHKGIRATTIGSVGNAATVLSYPNFSERGRTDIASMPEPGVDIIEGGMDSIWDTWVFDPAVTVGSGAPITFNGQPLKVATITLSSPQGNRNFSGLVGHGGSGDSAIVVATVNKLHSPTTPLTIQLGGRR